jgi:uracil-DNA glycosylase family 4
MVVLVGEAPGAAEDREGRPFVGRSGQRLDTALTRAGLGPEEFGIVNLLKCRPPGNRFDPHAATTCRPYLDRQLAILDTRLLVSLGARALAALDPRAPPITQCAGTIRSAHSPPIFPMLHPAAPLHDPRLRDRWETDVRRLGEVVAELRDKAS